MRHIYTLAVLALSTAAVNAADSEQQQLTELERRLAELEADLASTREALLQLKAEQEEASQQESDSDGEFEQRLSAVEQSRSPSIRLGGAVRFQYVLADYDRGQKRRGGDMQFDLFRLNFDGEMNGAILSAEYRWFEYMDALRHAYFGYNFTDEWQGQIGVVIQPWGVMPYNSHSYFFSSNFYLGFEDNPGTGIKFTRRTQSWDFDIALILNDDLGGSTGDVRSRADSYSYNVVGIRQPGEAFGAKPEFTASENNTLITRIARRWAFGGDSLELGLSGQYGDIDDGSSSVGNKRALGLHTVYQRGRWEFHGQYTHYDYDLDIANEGVVVGAYAYFDTIPTRASVWTGNVAYDYPFDWGPVESLRFYNNTSLVTDKRDYQQDTWMNVLGMAVTAGGIYTYFDLVSATNQPFVNGSVVGESNRWHTRFNINFGYYF